jgi:Asp-tRNA(Asn)/Glu-tRNA(Gln) amidotransferase A subunit family amidase
MTDDLHALPATALGAAFGSGHLDPVAVLESVLARVAHFEPHVQALWALDEPAARAAAEASAARWRAGRPLSALDGVPVTVKENIATAGCPVPLGTAATGLTPAAADAPPAARLREAGAVVFARTTMPDFGMLSSGLSSFHALARNPWDVERNPGGSSAGAGAAAAAGYGPLHLGTDIGGSIRLPAAWCGVVGFKPSLGRLPIQPPYAGRVAGPMTRHVADAALAMSVLARPDPRDTMSLPPQELPWRQLHGGRGALQAGREAGGLSGLRVGLWLDAGTGLALHPGLRAVVEEAAARLARAGATLVPVPPFVTRAMLDGMDRFWRVRSWLDLQALPEERRQRVLPYIRRWAEGGAGCSAAELFAAQAQMGVLREASVAALKGLDFLIGPVTPVPTFPAAWASPTNDPARPLEHIAFTLPWNFGEQPALSVPAGLGPDGLPAAVQIVGQRHDDLGVLRLGHAFERLRGVLPAWPEPPPRPVSRPEGAASTDPP